MDDLGKPNITDKEQRSLEALERLGRPVTIREWADEMQTAQHRAERTSDGELRSRAERMEEKGLLFHEDGLYRAA